MGTGGLHHTPPHTSHTYKKDTCSLETGQVGTVAKFLVQNYMFEQTLLHTLGFSMSGSDQDEKYSPIVSILVSFHNDLKSN